MTHQHAAALGAGAGCVGAALGASVTVLGLVQVLSMALEENDQPEDQTEAEWATDRLNRLRLHGFRRCRRRVRYSEIAHGRCGNTTLG
jgi:hypothetical protein